MKLPKVKKKPFNKEEFVKRAKAFDKPKLTPLKRLYEWKDGELTYPAPNLVDAIIELQDYVTALEDRVRVLESNSWRGHR